MIETNLIQMPKIRMNLTFKSFTQAVMVFYAFVFFVSAYCVVEASLAFQHLIVGIGALGFAGVIETKPLLYVEAEEFHTWDNAGIDVEKEAELLEAELAEKEKV